MKKRSNSTPLDELNRLISRIGAAGVDHEELWTRITDLLDALPLDEAEEDVLPSLAPALRRWPASTERRIPVSWLVAAAQDQPHLPLDVCTELCLSRDDLAELHDPEAEDAKPYPELLAETLGIALGWGLPSLNLTLALDGLSAEELERALAPLTEGEGALTRLRLRYNDQDAALTEWLAGYPGLGRLTLLDLAGNSLDDDAVVALVEAFPADNRLTLLFLEDNEALGLEALSAVVRKKKLARLEDLYFGDTALSEAALEATEPEDVPDLKEALGAQGYSRLKRVLRDVELGEYEARALHIHQGTLEAYLHLKRRVDAAGLSGARYQDVLDLLRQSDLRQIESVLDHALAYHAEDEDYDDAPLVLAADASDVDDDALDYDYGEEGYEE